MPLNLGPMEMVFVMVVLLLVFGAKRLPELGSGLGKGIREFRNTMRDVNGEITAATTVQRAAPAQRPDAIQPPSSASVPSAADVRVEAPNQKPEDA